MWTLRRAMQNTVGAARAYPRRGICDCLVALGPATREAIRKFQVAAGEAETGEPSEMLFESLKKKCASSAR